MCIVFNRRQIRVRTPSPHSLCVLLQEFTQTQPSRARHPPRREPLPVTTRWRPWTQPDPPQLIYLPKKYSFTFDLWLSLGLALSTPSWGKPGAGGEMNYGSPRGGAGVPLLGLREEGWGSGSWVLAWGGFRGPDVGVLRRRDAEFSP